MSYKFKSPGMNNLQSRLHSERDTISSLAFIWKEGEKLLNSKLALSGNIALQLKEHVAGQCSDFTAKEMEVFLSKVRSS